MTRLLLRSALAPAMLVGALVSSAQAGDWSSPADVRHHDEELCVSYQARLDGPYLVVRANLEPGWHTFAMDNQKRADEKLAGKMSLGIDQPTEIRVSGLETTGPWYQSPPEDFSKPALHWYSWGFERQALFVTRARRSGAAAKIAIRGQACTDKICRNVDVQLSLPPTGAEKQDARAEISLDNLVQVR